MIQSIIHYTLHFIAPAAIAYAFYRTYWKRAYMIMMSTMLIDLDHLLASPVFDPNRCSIGFHPLHSAYAIVFYIMLLLPKKTRLVGIGLTLHIVADQLDCWMMG